MNVKVITRNGNSFTWGGLPTPIENFARLPVVGEYIELEVWHRVDIVVHTPFDVDRQNEPDKYIAVIYCTAVDRGEADRVFRQPGVPDIR